LSVEIGPPPDAHTRLRTNPSGFTLQKPRLPASTFSTQASKE
jgi:hypothetical protein